MIRPRPEDEIAASEQAVAERERELYPRLDEASSDLAARRQALEQRLSALGSSGLCAPQEVEAVRRMVGGVQLPGGDAQAREAALTARIAALQAREAAAAAMADTLQHWAEVEAHLARAEASAERLARAVEMRRVQFEREEQDRLRADEQARRAAEEQARRAEEEQRRAEAMRRRAEALAAQAALEQAQVAQVARIQPKPAPSTPEVTGPHGRMHLRVTAVGEVNAQSESNFFVGFSENISSGGLFLATYGPRPRGTPIRVRFNLENRHIEANGHVAWVRELNELNPDMVPGMGIVFDGLSPADQRAIDEFIHRRDPMFVPM